MAKDPHSRMEYADIDWRKWWGKEYTVPTHAQVNNDWYYIQNPQQPIEIIGRPVDSLEEFNSLQSQGNGFFDEFQKTGELEVLNRAIKYREQSIEVYLEDSIERTYSLQSLGYAYTSRFQRTGRISDVEQAIQYFHQSLNAKHPDYLGKARLLLNLGICYACRFQTNALLHDLYQSISYYEQSLETWNMEPDYPEERSKCLQCLANAVRDLYQRTNKIDDLDQSLNYARQSLKASPDSPERGRSLLELGIGLGTRFLKTGNAIDLEQSPEYYHQSFEAQSDLLESARGLYWLGYGYSTQHRFTGKAHYLEQSIQYYQQSLDIWPMDHPGRGFTSLALGLEFQNRFHFEYSLVDRTKSNENFESALFSQNSPSSVRIRAGLELVKSLSKEEQWDSAVHVVDEILELFPDLTVPTQTRDDMQVSLQQLSGISSIAASVFLKAGKPAIEALEVLERGRGIIASLTMDTRSDISVLKEKHPNLWSRYTECQQKLSTVNTDAGSSLGTNLEEFYVIKNKRRQDLFGTLENLRKEVRSHPGLERFLLPLTESQILDLAQAGPIVCYNMSEISSDAIITSTESIQAIHLPGLNKVDIQRHIKYFSLRGNAARRDVMLVGLDTDDIPSASDGLVELQYIWEFAVKPVLRQLGLLEQSKVIDTISRIHWVGGIMSLLPLHAAGDHNLGSTENTFSHVVSSFAPTIKALQYAREKSLFSLKNKKPEILIVSMPRTPGGFEPLNVAEEVEAIRNHSSSFASVTCLENPDKDSVVEKLKSCTIAHFACHGYSDPIEPAQSALILGNKAEERLTIQDLDEVIHDRAQLVYLSACSTAEIRTLRLIDESVHLASSFQLVGFQNVIGTLWGADDNAAVTIAARFYKELLKQNHIDTGSIAQALQNAVLYYRSLDGNLAVVTKWAPFIHLG
jgi:tetratricopeptide (TPR) repeat protein